MKKRDNYLFFYGGIYSQWYPSEFHFNNVQYNCAEQFMMAAKARLFNDNETLDLIMKSSDPAIQKRLGRSVSNFDKDVWMEEALDVVTLGNVLKFTQSDGLMKQFISDANDGKTTFVEASPYDKIWGIGLSVDAAIKADESEWKGTNLLGVAINRAYDIITQTKIGVLLNLTNAGCL
jgi:ribA/ribD-fused uncharacterized protein